MSGDILHPVQASTGGYPRTVEANGLEIYVDQVGQGPDVLLIGGLGDTVESWEFQLDGLADRYRLTAFDNRGAGEPNERDIANRDRERDPPAAAHEPERRKHDGPSGAG